MTGFWFVLAAMLEIAGCFATLQWLRDGRSPVWILVAGASPVRAVSSGTE